jgi:hypothetical protein
MTARQLNRVESLWQRQPNDGIPTTPWMAGAPFPCRRNPDLFFSEDADEVAEAKRICNTECSFTRRTACRAYANDQRIPFGVFGGQDENERGIPVPEMFRCTSCGDEKDVSHRRGEWCAACHKRWQAAGKAASEASRTARFQARLTQYADLRASGKSNAEAATAVGVSKWRGQEYARLLKDQLPVAVVTEIHPWRQGDAVIPNLEATA